VAAVLAEHPELLEQAGLDLEIELYRSGKTQGEDVAAGELSAYFTCGVPAAHMLTSGPGARVVGSPGELGRIAVVARAEAATRLEDLRGHRVGLAKGSTPAMDWEIWGKDLGATVVPLKTEQLERALLDGEVDAVVSWDPWVEQWLQAAPDQLAVLAERPFWSQLAMDPSWTRRERSQAEALMAVIERALILAAADRAHYDQAVADLSGWPVEVVRAVADRNRFLSGAHDADLDLTAEAIDELLRSARWTHGERADGRTLLDPELATVPEPTPPPAPAPRTPSDLPARPQAPTDR
jgi:ABC-type nitrate/sulfonate/bicarbonate transport system substrate-binding protein